MSSPDRHDIYQFDILRHVEKSPCLSNRGAARKLGVSVKLAHELLKGMVSRGLLHVRVVNARRWDYFLTPKGIAEKARLTLEFLDFSLHFYREARRRSSQVCRDLAEVGARRVVLLGAGDLAEIVYLGIQEWGMELSGVYADTGPERLLGKPVSPVADLARVPLDVPIIVCVYDARQPMREGYLPDGIDRRPNLHWIFT